MVIKFFKKTFLKLLLISFSVLLITVPLVWLQLGHPQQFQSIIQIIAHHPTLWTAFRWMLIAILCGGWPYFIQHYAQKYTWSSEKTAFWLAQRYRLCAWLIIFELLVCENLLQKLINYF